MIAVLCRVQIADSGTAIGEMPPKKGSKKKKKKKVSSSELVNQIKKMI